MKFNKIFNRNNFALFGFITSLVLALLQVVSLIMLIFNNLGNAQAVIVDAFSLIISVAFYLFIAFYFKKSKLNFGYAFSALFSLLLCDYIIPLIFDYIESIFSLSIIFPSIIALLAVVYFIFMLLETKNRNKKYLTTLKVIGIIFGVAALGLGIYNLTTLIIFFDFSGDVTSIFSIVIIIIYTVAEMICLPIVFACYPFILAKERYYY